MAECDERSCLAALSLMNSGMEADDGSNKTVVAVMCPIRAFRTLGKMTLVRYTASRTTDRY
jgi:hypothetical protein